MSDLQTVSDNICLITTAGIVADVLVTRKQKHKRRKNHRLAEGYER